MKTSLIFIFIWVPFGYLFGEIKNGFQGELKQTQESINRLSSKLLNDKSLTTLQRLHIKSEIRNLSHFLVCYRLTQEVIRQLESVSPDLFDEMNNIKDKKERITDVYVKLIPREQARTTLKAATYFTRVPDDEDAPISEYGKYSVSIIIWIMDNSLQLLYHELGHVKYIVPNLSSYCQFFKKRYHQVVDLGNLGHDRYDQSGKVARDFEQRFFKDREKYVSKHNEKLKSANSMMQSIARNSRDGGDVLTLELIRSPAPNKLIARSKRNYIIIDPKMIEKSIVDGWHGLKKIPGFQ